jgi:serine O-acetyltransferase
MNGISVTDLLIVWIATALGALALHLAFVLMVFARSAALGRPDSRPMSYSTFAQKQKLRSGRGLRLSYPYVLALLTLDNGIQAAFLHRVANRFARGKLRALAAVIHAFSKLLTHIDISPRAEIEGGVYFYHGAGVVIGKATVIGRRVTICQGVTTGGGRPRIGDDATLWAGAKVIGDVTIGERAQVGANAVVLQDVPADCIAVGVPATRFLPLNQPETPAVGTPAESRSS